MIRQMHEDGRNGCLPGVYRGLRLAAGRMVRTGLIGLPTLDCLRPPRIAPPEDRTLQCAIVENIPLPVHAAQLLGFGYRFCPVGEGAVPGPSRRSSIALRPRREARRCFAWTGGLSGYFGEQFLTSARTHALINSRFRPLLDATGEVGPFALRPGLGIQRHRTDCHSARCRRCLEIVLSANRGRPSSSRVSGNPAIDPLARLLLRQSLLEYHIDRDVRPFQAS